MICPNCKATVEEGSAFCGFCGTKLGQPASQDQGQAPQMQQPQSRPQMQSSAQSSAQTAQASAQQTSYQFRESEPQTAQPDNAGGGSNVGKIIAIAVGAVVALAVVIGIVFIVKANMKKTINLEEFVEVSYSGCDGYATAYASIDTAALVKEIKEKCNLDEISEDDVYTDTQLAALFAYEEKIDDAYDSVEVSIPGSKNGTYKNGDTFTVTLKYDDTNAQEIGIKFEGEDMTFTVEGLEEVEAVDVFEGVTVEFSGVSPYGTATLVNNGEYSNYDYTLDQTENLENGDVVVVTFDQSTADSMIYDGKTPEAMSMSFTVALSEYLTSLDDLSDTFLNEAQEEAEAVFEDVRSDWSETVTFESMDYETAYILTRDEYSSWYSNYILYLVYEISVTQENRDFTYYWYIGYYDALVDADGNVEVDYEYYTIPEEGGWFTDGTECYFTTYSNTNGALTLTYTGYSDLAALFEDLIRSEDGYSYEGTEYTEADITETETMGTFIPEDAYEYDGHSYMIIYASISWAEAEEICESLGGHLAVITTEGENEFLTSLTDDNFWIGASCDTSYNWSWVTAETFSYTNWDEGEPSGGDEYYAEIYGWDGTWNDLDGEANWLVDGFICEWD